MKPSYAFIGSGAFAARCLKLLCEWKAPSWIVTGPSRPAGRGRSLQGTPVSDMGRTERTLNGVQLVESSDASRDDAVLAMKARLLVDFTFVADFGQIIREPLLAWDAPIGCLNIHPSLLPLYRGAAPVQRALMEGAGETGVTIFKLAPGMDCGPILLQERITVNDDDDSGALLERAALIGTSAFIELTERTPLSQWRFTEQDEARATTAPKIKREEERIDWQTDSLRISRKIRALQPQPSAWTTLRGKRLRVIEAHPIAAEGEPGKLMGLFDGLPAVACLEGAIALRRVQMEGRPVTDAAEWWRGIRAEGEVLV